MPLRASSPRSFRFAMPSTGVFTTIALCAGLAAWSTPAQTRPLGLETDEVPIIAAVKSEDPDAVAVLLGEATDVDAAQPDGATALHWAAFRDNLVIADLLINAGADVGTANELGATALWLAADNGSALMVERLLAAGARPNVALPEGETPIMTASRTGSVDAVRALLAAGADVNATEDTRGQTALMWAVAQGHHAVVATLLDHGAAVTARSKARPRLMYADNTNASQYDQGMMWNRGGFTPLLFAARHGDIASAKLLLAAGAGVDDAAPTGATPLVVAAHSGHAEFAALLLDQGADPDAIDAGYTALHAATLRGEERLVEALLEHGADPDLRLESGTPLRRTSQDWAFNPALVSATPYWLAAYFREPNIMRDLVAAGADPRLTTRELWRPVFERAGGVGAPHNAGGFVPPLLAALRGPANKGRFFLGSAGDPNEEEQKALEAVRVAVEFGADVNQIDARGGAALHAAAQLNFTTVVRLLAEQGADLNLEDERGRTPLQLAIGAAAGRERSSILADRAPAGNTADVLRELGAVDPDQADAESDEAR